jgi:hypothetical protein
VSSEVLTYAITAGQTTVASSGRIFNLLSAPGGPISIVADRRSVQGGQSLQRNFTNIPAGSKFTAPRGEEWTYLRITSAVSQQITIFIGDDDMQFNNAVTVTGTASVSVNPSATINDTADTVQAFGTQTVIAANLSRRRITIGNDIVSTVPIRVSGGGGAGKGIQIQPGTFAEFDTTASLTVRNDAAAGSATWCALEEV